MKVLFPLRPDIYSERLIEYSPMARAVEIGNELTEIGSTVDYLTSISSQSDVIHPESKIYEVLPTTPYSRVITESFLLYREYHYDILHIQTAAFSLFGHILNLMRLDDRVVVTLHAPANIGRSFYHCVPAIRKLLDYPYFRLVVLSVKGGLIPLNRALGFSSLKVSVIPNGVSNCGVQPVPWNQKIRRFMFVAHLYQSKNVEQTLLTSIENNIQCLYVGRRTPHTKLSHRDEEYANRCEQLINRNRHLIEYYPVLPHAQVLQEMARSRHLLVMSDVESCASTPLEAVSVGTPVVWLQCQGVDDTMSEPVTGVMISRKNNRRWTLRRQRAAEMINFGWEHVTSQESMINYAKQNYSVRACAQKYEALYY